MPTSADLLLDTSAAIGLMLTGHEHHDAVIARAEGLVLGLSGHASVETYSVLTRLPGEQRLRASTARQIIKANFPATVALPPDDALSAIEVLAEAGIAGGAVYDGLVGLAARAAGIRLLTCDRRALPTYAALSVEVQLV